MTNTTNDAGSAEQATSDKSAQSECNGLLACPFCGGKAKIKKRKTVIIECQDCHVLFIKMSEEEAYLSWNNRFMRTVEAKKIPTETRVIAVRYKDDKARRCTMFITTGADNQTDKMVELINNGR